MCRLTWSLTSALAQRITRRQLQFSCRILQKKAVKRSKLVFRGRSPIPSPDLEHPSSMYKSMGEKRASNIPYFPEWKEYSLGNVIRLLPNVLVEQSSVSHERSLCSSALHVRTSQGTENYRKICLECHLFLNRRHISFCDIEGLNSHVICRHQLTAKKLESWRFEFERCTLATPPQSRQVYTVCTALRQNRTTQ